MQILSICALTHTNSHAGSASPLAILSDGDDSLASRLIHSIGAQSGLQIGSPAISIPFAIALSIRQACSLTQPKSFAAFYSLTEGIAPAIVALRYARTCSFRTDSQGVRPSSNGASMRAQSSSLAGTSIPLTFYTLDT